MRGLPPPKPLAIKHRLSFLFVEKGQIDVLDGCCVVLDARGIRTQLPLGALTCLLLEPGTRISHAAVKLAADLGSLLMWVGEGGVRLYSAGQPGGARADRLLHQVRMALDEERRLAVIRKMYELRFGEPPPQRRSVEQLRGIEASRVKRSYQVLAERYGVSWKRRNYERGEWDATDTINRCLSTATSCLYGLSEAAVLAVGYAPPIGFIHTGSARSFVLDVADIFKFETVVPAAFSVAARQSRSPEREVRQACRDQFRQSKLLNRLVDVMDEVLLFRAEDAPEIEIHQPLAYEDNEATGDVGHRS